MANMPSDFWAGWVVTITVVSLIGLVWLIVSVYFARDSAADALDQIWDDTLREGSTPPPLWWFWFILALLAVSVVYLILYPGLGAYRGALRWSQGGQIAASTASYEQQFGAVRKQIAQTSIDALQQNGAAMRSASHVFSNNCSACHGADGQGQAQLFPNLRDGDWQWGAAEMQIAQTITLGRQAVMPPWQTVLGDAGVEQVAGYVMQLAAGTAAAAASSEGARVYKLYCGACHGAEGAGTPALGAPALNDQTWTYGGSVAEVRASIASGRNGVMPAFGKRLDEAQLKMLVAWLTPPRTAN